MNVISNFSSQKLFTTESELTRFLLVNASSSNKPPWQSSSPVPITTGLIRSRAARFAKGRKREATGLFPDIRDVTLEFCKKF